MQVLWDCVLLDLCFGYLVVETVHTHIFLLIYNSCDGSWLCSVAFYISKTVILINYALLT